MQARTQLEAVCCVRRIRHARVYDADASAADQFAVEMTQRLGLQVQRAADSAKALEEAAVVCTATTSNHPVFQDHELPPGVHINAVGSYKPDVTEIPSETVCRARVVVDHRASAIEEAGDLLVPLRQGLIQKAHMQTELGEVLARTISVCAAGNRVPRQLGSLPGADWGGWRTGLGTVAGPTWRPATGAFCRRASSGSSGTRTSSPSRPKTC